MKIVNIVTGHEEDARDVLLRKAKAGPRRCAKCEYVSYSDAEAYDHYMTEH